jgi:hypothetical protein
LEFGKSDQEQANRHCCHDQDLDEGHPGTRSHSETTTFSESTDPGSDR